MRTETRSAECHTCVHRVDLSNQLSVTATLFCCCSVAKWCLTLCDPTHCSTQASLFITNSQSLQKLMFIESVMPSNHLILCLPLLLLPSIFPRIRVFFNKLAVCIRWLKYWSFSFSTSPSNEYSGLISFRIHFFFISLQSQGLTRVFSSTTVRKHRFFGSQLSLCSISHNYTWLLEKP